MIQTTSSTQTALRAAVEIMLQAERDYYLALRTSLQQTVVNAARIARTQAEIAAAAAVPTNEQGEPIHTCGHAIYVYNSPKLTALDGMDPCRECSYRATVDSLTGKTIIVHRYRIIGTMMVDYAAMIAESDLGGDGWHGPHCSTIHHYAEAGYGDVSTYFNETVFAGLKSRSKERSAKVTRFQALAKAHAQALIQQAWPEDFAPRPCACPLPSYQYCEGAKTPAQVRCQAGK